MIDFLKEEETRTQSYRGKIIRRCWEKATVYKPRRDASEETNPVDTLIMDFSLQNGGTVHFLCVSHTVWGAF